MKKLQFHKLNKGDWRRVSVVLYKVATYTYSTALPDMQFRLELVQIMQSAQVESD